ncbi:MerR family transcriptional regulator [Actinokineospora sp. PR83]|uniref:MerR family transcriptional regulator n=1 Tax=Actinokineospora sp. PR83 TaxID=2884908 RepID=UPI001F43A192|nr:MerR family transcriptional regulator [Actinokineospora sp. PR83]MCG8917710.1 MerR family transcriptional regulator [Actinokineospora sp. PR83]
MREGRDVAGDTDRAAPDTTETGPQSAPDRAGAGHVHIGEVAARTELSLRTIRHYDEVGLVTPSARTRGGFRLYTADDIARLMLIRRMKPLGFTLEQMRDLLAATDRLDAIDTPDAPDRDEHARLMAVVADFETAALRRCEELRAMAARAGEFAAELGARLRPTPPG